MDLHMRYSEAYGREIPIVNLSEGAKGEVVFSDGRKSECVVFRLLIRSKVRVIALKDRYDGEVELDDVGGFMVQLDGEEVHVMLSSDRMMLMEMA